MKESQICRIVVDLSWPLGMSINDGIPENEYLGSQIDLKLPTIDFMSDTVWELGPGCLMYKLDLSHGYRLELHSPLTNSSGSSPWANSPSSS